MGLFDPKGQITPPANALRARCLEGLSALLAPCTRADTDSNNLCYGREDAKMNKCSLFMLQALAFLLLFALPAGFMVYNSQNAGTYSQIPMGHEVVLDEVLDGLYSSLQDFYWFEWFNSLCPERQDKVSFRPANFAKVQRDFFGIEVTKPLVPHIVAVDLCVK